MMPRAFGLVMAIHAALGVFHPPVLPQTGYAYPLGRVQRSKHTTAQEKRAALKARNKKRSRK